LAFLLEVVELKEDLLAQLGQIPLEQARLRQTQKTQEFLVEQS
jgi:hypothetical protein